MARQTLFIIPFFLTSLLACTDTMEEPGVDSGTPGADSGTPSADSGTGSDASVEDSGGDDGGELPTAPEVEIEVAAECAALTPCGGDVIGTWAYSDGCAEADLSDLTDACPAATIDLTATGRGVVRIDATTITREAVVRSDAEISVPASCAMIGCDMVAAILSSAGDASCTEAGGGCDCTLTRTETTSDIDGYRLEGNSLITDAGDTYDYCRDGSSLVYGERDGQDVFTLSPL